MFDIRALLIAIPALPLVAAILTAVLGPRLLRQRSHWLAVLAIAGSFLCSVMLLADVHRNMQSPEDDTFVQVGPLATWVQVDQALPDGISTNIRSAFKIDVTLRADSLTAIMLCMVTVISTLVVIYSAGYMHGDRSYWRFFTYISLFVFSMTMLVLVSNFLLLYVFWEAVGACSYLLIGFWYEKPTAAVAGKKAFLVNRVGDFGFALALFLIWTTYGSLDYYDVTEGGEVLSYGVFGETRLNGDMEFVAGPTALAICLLLMLGACGKSAQFPLHVWLPDAMEGPTPVSALIHAATMVTAGVYMVARCTPLFMVAPDAQLVVACIGGITALMAGIIALTQNDLKRVLAYSTISQLGYMFLALGTGTVAGIVAAIFHLFTHAFFKALLFLGAGSVMHGMGNVIDMRRLGGLRHIMPITCVTFAIGSLALAGIPPLSGFYSKDAILGAVRDRIHEADHALVHRADSLPDVEARAAMAHGGQHAFLSVYASMVPEKVRLHRQAFHWLYWSGLLTAFLTAFYTFRAFFMIFYGTEVVPEEAAGHAHESPQVMWVPLVILSFFALFVGFVIFYSSIFYSSEKHQPDVFASFLSTTPALAYEAARNTTQPGEFHVEVAAASVLVALAGIGCAAFLYLGDRRELRLLTYFFDFGDYLSPYKLAQGKFFFDEIYDILIVRPLRFCADAFYVLDRWLVDGLVNLCGYIPLACGGRLRKLQGGLLPLYSLAMVLGTLTLIAARILWGS